MFLSLLASKFLWIAGGLVALFIGLHTAIGAWRSDIRENEILKIANEQHELAIQQREEQLELINQAHEKAQAEVEWARNYVSKQEAAIERLKEEASIEVNECLDVYIDSEFVH